MSKPITLLCRKCGRKMKYGRKVDPTVPIEVCVIRLQCDKCNAGDFDEEEWFDKDGNEINQATKEGER